MRNMYPDTEYFEHLDGLRRSGEWNSVLAPVSLMEAFPGLRAEEARAVCMCSPTMCTHGINFFAATS